MAVFEWVYPGKISQDPVPDSERTVENKTDQSVVLRIYADTSKRTIQISVADRSGCFTHGVAFSIAYNILTAVEFVRHGTSE